MHRALMALILGAVLASTAQNASAYGDKVGDLGGARASAQRNPPNAVGSQRSPIPSANKAGSPVTKPWLYAFSYDSFCPNGPPATDCYVYGR